MVDLLSHAYTGSTMKEFRVVVLYGGSLLLAGLETCLQELPGLRVVSINNTHNGSAQQLQSLQLDAVIFDSNDNSVRDWPNLIRLLKERPDAIVIGLGASDHDLIILSSQQRTANNLEDVIAAIRLRSGTTETE